MNAKAVYFPANPSTIMCVPELFFFNKPFVAIDKKTEAIIFDIFAELKSAREMLGRVCKLTFCKNLLQTPNILRKTQK